ncbi:hypothetical protein P4O66_000260 [Electrophorus voltai]|uniref:Reverse transcriptase domain-containing protein n=1 Tax=Electrophorus voltai TaxID=2609070 RepID=A0AAD8ZJS3_9TELE|nr:hypothetical protein P4O66_000260 [Electrophorus voltai]
MTKYVTRRSKPRRDYKEVSFRLTYVGGDNGAILRLNKKLPEVSFRLTYVGGDNGAILRLNKKLPVGIVGPSRVHLRVLVLLVQLFSAGLCTVRSQTIHRASPKSISGFLPSGSSMKRGQDKGRITIKKFSNQKPWVDRTIREALNSRTAAYNAGIISGNMDEYKSAAYGVRRAVREAKRRYGKKLETQFQQSGSRSLWQGLRMITDYRSPPSGLMNADESLANELNTFFARFEATSSSANASSTNANGTSANSANANSAGASGTIGAAGGTCAGPTIEQRPLIITESDVRRVFKRVNTRKAMGPDGICGRVLKACADQLAPVFTDIFNLSLTLGIVPSSFKRSTIVPVPKKP